MSIMAFIMPYSQSLQPTHLIWPMGTLVHIAQNLTEKMAFQKIPKSLKGWGQGYIGGQKSQR